MENKELICFLLDSLLLPGWVEGTRLSDRHRGWIPVSHLETITNTRVRQRNLSDALKLTTATAAVWARISVWHYRGEIMDGCTVKDQTHSCQLQAYGDSPVDYSVLKMWISTSELCNCWFARIMHVSVMFGLACSLGGPGTMHTHLHTETCWNTLRTLWAYSLFKSLHLNHLNYKQLCVYCNTTMDRCLVKKNCKMYALCILNRRV